MDQSVKASNNKLLGFLRNYKGLIAAVVTLSLLVNILGLILPRLNARVIDSLRDGSYSRNDALLLFALLTGAILLFSLAQAVLGNITAEKIAAEIRRQVVDKVSRQSFRYINSVTTARLLTNLTADTDAVKQFINQGIVIAFAALVQLVGSAVILLSMNWQLALPILLTIPVLGVTFGIIFKFIEKYFTQAQEIIDRLNRVINETIVGSALIRVLNSRGVEKTKFDVVNQEARTVGVKIIIGFASLIPIINLVVSASFLIVVGFGGVQVIDGTLSPGDFSAFFSYIFIFISPVILLGFLASSIGRAFATYTRIREVIDAPEPEYKGTVKKEILGEIELKAVNLVLDSKPILSNISFKVKPSTRVGIIGPTAAGKTQIFYLISGLITPESGEILIDGTKITDYDTQALYAQMGMVFQDSIIFNTTIRENIAFRNKQMSSASIQKAIETAELNDFIATLPQGLDTRISERGASLSGGQKQRLTLARALALNPKILLLDDFTARVDVNTERKIFANLQKNYPETTVVAITQKISSIAEFDQIILVMEGELVTSGTHKELLEKSLEYQQIYKSQQRTDN